MSELSELLAKRHINQHLRSLRLLAICSFSPHAFASKSQVIKSPQFLKMADVEMADADTGAAPVESKKIVKGTKTGVAETVGENKKRFEVKKVCLLSVKVTRR